MKDVDDLIFGSVVEGILKGIRHCLQGESWGAVLILTYVGIDVMAYLGLQEGKEEQTRRDFIRWVERYMRLPTGKSYNGTDLYAARSSILHRYSAESDMTKKGKARSVVYCHGRYPPIQEHPAKLLVMLEIGALVSSFVEGMERFLSEVLADEKRKSVVQPRLRKLFRYTTEEEILRRTANKES